MTTEATIIVAIFGSTGLWKLVEVILTRKYNKKDKEDDKEDLVMSALQGLLHEALERRCLEALAEGEVTLAQHETIEALWEPYCKMGLNGTGRALHESVNALGLKKE